MKLGPFLSVGDGREGFYEWAERMVALGWQSWFAWHPVKVADRDWRWLETVERKYDKRDDSYLGTYYVWEYRAHRARDKYSATVTRAKR